MQISAEIPSVSKEIEKSLKDYSQKFFKLNSRYDHTLLNHSELETLINDFSQFVTSEKNQKLWAQLNQQDFIELGELILNLRQRSALGVAVMEKYRALKLQEGASEISDYFKNIESCIDKEFGSFHIGSDSKVLIVGSGSFPMTPILIAKRTGAEVVGIDIDEEAVQLGDSVVKKIGNDLNISLEKTPAECLNFTKDATHIIFSSTIKEKYKILDELYKVTNEEVVVAMRYGNHLKSLFNYPLQQTDDRKWILAEKIVRPKGVFDIALYKKTL